MNSEDNKKIGTSIHEEKGENLAKDYKKITKEQQKRENPQVNPKVVFGNKYKEPKKSKMKKSKSTSN